MNLSHPTLPAASRFAASRLGALLIALCCACAGAFAAERGFFGFSIAVETEGFSFNPTLQAVRIEKVSPGSPAAAAGLEKGDQFLEVEGRVVAGAKADDLKPHLQKNVGDTLTVKVKKASGPVVVVVLTAAARP